MIPELFHIGPLSISPFGVLMAVGFAAAWAQLLWGVRKLGLGSEEDASALLLAAGVGGIAGGKVYYAVLYGDWRLLFSRSGLVWYGAFVLGTLAVLWTARHRRLPIPGVADAAGPTVALGYGIGRIGCFLVGDDYGFPTDLPWGVAFPYGLPGPTTAGFLRREYGLELSGRRPEELVAVHPTQLYESLAGLLAWAVGIALIRRKVRAGHAGLAVFALLALERFGVEFLRAKDDRFVAGFTLAQLWSLAILLLLGGLWTLSRRREAAAATDG